MAKTIITVKTFTYVVYTDTVCTVTDTETGRELATAVPGVPNYFTAMGGSVTLSDDAATIMKPVFKCAPAALGLVGGGPKLPPGYTLLEFLESTGTQYIDTEFVPDANSGLLVICESANTNDYIPFGCRNSGGSNTRFACSRMRKTTDGRVSAGYGWGEWFTFSTASEADGNSVCGEGRLNWKNSMQAEYRRQEGEDFVSIGLAPLEFTPLYSCYMFACNVAGKALYPLGGRLYKAGISVGERVQHLFQPALTPAGSPCMFDLVSGAQYPNKGTGHFIAGVGDIPQLVTLLRNLPVTDEVRELVLSLPAEANTPEITELMNSAGLNKGWTLTVAEYRPAAAVTYSLRRVRQVVWCRKGQDDNGRYVAADGTRWQVERCAAVFGPLGQDPAAYGYAPFDSVEHAAEVWELEPYQTPEEENLTAE